MSRIGKLPIPFGSKVTVDYKSGMLKVKGPLGEMKYETPAEVDLKIEDAVMTVVADFGTSVGRMMSGTARSVIANMVHGVSEGFNKVLELNGVGYRAQLKGQELTLALGFSHPVVYQLPKNLTAQVDNTTKITLTSFDKQLLGQVAAEIRKYRPPEPYKGKGILFAGEQIRRKAGKAAKSG